MRPLRPRRILSLAVLGAAAANALVALDRPALAASAACPPQATLSVQNVPRSLPWGNRATIRVINPPSAEITHLSVAWADSGEVFAEADELFDFWIEAEHPNPTIGFVVTWTARYLDANLVQQTCSGTLEPTTISSGLDKRLRINQSLVAIRLNDSEARVRNVLGPPARITRPYSSLRIFNYRAWKLQVWFYPAGSRWNVQSVRTTSRAFRTDRDVGVGTGSATSFTLADLVNPLHTVAPGYRDQGGAWVVGRRAQGAAERSNAAMGRTMSS